MTVIVKGEAQKMGLGRKIKAFSKYVLPYPKKLYNLIGLKLAIKLGRPQWKFYPVKLGVETTNNCNLRCPLCVRALEKLNRQKGVMSFNDYKQVIDSMGDYLIQARLHGWGEPFMNPDLTKFIAYTHKRGIYTNFHTNGHFLTKKT